ncbi:hypothetical protein H5410_060089 [Solanum commersonii]|uniref:Phospholipase A1 n=1 Tax=Solanum commersonii TaxID=4109 RepID=A0A9J5W449_SOLCO|nr:hypothetical protein H5410_060089 [Solanum commersonii]
MAEKWEELSGKNNWEGLLHPLDIDLRKYIIQYGELAQATYDTFITERASKYAGASRYSMENLLLRLDLTQTSIAEAWSKESNFMGYIAVATDDGKASLGRRDIVIN